MHFLDIHYDSVKNLVVGVLTSNGKICQVLVDEKGRQVYVVYPLIKESQAMDYKDLMDGYESVVREFPRPDYQVSIVHGKMSGKDKDFEMKRFINKLFSFIINYLTHD